LSATVGNPADLLRWVQGSVAGSRPGHVIAQDVWLPSEVTSYPAHDTEAGVFEGDHSADVELDYVGSAENATRVIAAALDSLGQHPQIGLGNGSVVRRDAEGDMVERRTRPRQSAGGRRSGPTDKTPAACARAGTAETGARAPNGTEIGRKAGQLEASGTVGPCAEACAVAGAVSECPGLGVIPLADDATPCGKGSRQAGLDMLPGNRHVDVHRVPQWLGLVEILHPDRRPMAERIDRVVFGQFRVPEDGPPEAELHGFWMGRDGELDLLRPAAIRDGSLPSRDRGDGSRKLDVQRLQLEDTARQPHRELVSGDCDTHIRVLDAGHLRYRISKPCRVAE
jgi:hypothetical protein